MSPVFKAAEISDRFETALREFDALLAAAGEPLAPVRQRLQNGLAEYKQQGSLTVAFVGQYSAGKSTIISALTGRRDIHIDADIATDKTTTYDWNGIKIIDTPGLFTDRPDHDATTYEAIAKADLLVFCLTHMLFDTLTAENFKKLAYTEGYRWKTMLVVNKMSAGASDSQEQKIASYRHSLSEALNPPDSAESPGDAKTRISYDIDEFPICFIDARDYCEGVDEGDPDWAQGSHFDCFINELNQFIHRRSSLAKLDTPIRWTLSCLDDAQIGFARDSDEDAAFLEVLARLSRQIHKERERLRTTVKTIALELVAAINAEGSRLALAVGEDDFESLNAQAEIKARQAYERAGDAFESALQQAAQSMRRAVQTELKSNLTQAFAAQLNFDGEINAQQLSDPKHRQLRGQVAWLQQIGDQFGTQVTKLATRELASTAGSGLLRSIDAAGSQLHAGIYGAGKLVGFKFQPWQAVGMAKNIGNAARFLGPAVAIASILIDWSDMHREREHERKMADIRRDITSQFKAIAADLEQQMHTQLQQFEGQVYGQIEDYIADARRQTEAAMAASRSELSQLATIRQTLQSVLGAIADQDAQSSRREAEPVDGRSLVKA